MKEIHCTNSTSSGLLRDMATTVAFKRNGEEIDLHIKLTLVPGKPMLECEEEILRALDEAGRLATQETLSDFDTDGAPIEIGGLKLTSKGPVEKDYQSPFGAVRVARHVYQSSEGGQTFARWTSKRASSIPRLPGLPGCAVLSTSP